MKKRFLIFTFISICCFFIGILPSKATELNLENEMGTSNTNMTETYDNYTDSTVSCGNGIIEKIPTQIPKVISIAYLIIQVAVPIVLVVMGMLDLFKSMISAKEEDMKKSRQLFVKRLISAIVIFFVFVIVKFVIGFVADNSAIDIMDCASCFLENKCEK